MPSAPALVRMAADGSCTVTSAAAARATWDRVEAKLGGTTLVMRAQRAGRDDLEADDATLALPLPLPFGAHVLRAPAEFSVAGRALRVAELDELLRTALELTRNAHEVIPKHTGFDGFVMAAAGAEGGLDESDEDSHHSEDSHDSGSEADDADEVSADEEEDEPDDDEKYDSDERTDDDGEGVDDEEDGRGGDEKV